MPIYFCKMFFSIKDLHNYMLFCSGVPAALVSIDAVNQLCDLLLAPAEQVRGCAAISLGYLSYDPHALRQLLNR